MVSTVNTIYATALQLANFRGVKYTPMVNTTLNEKFDILVDHTDIKETIHNPKLSCFAIGNGNIPSLKGDISNDSVLYHGVHKPIDGALFNHIPFILREAYKDISKFDRLKYRLRKEYILNNVKYYAYYLKVIPEDNFESKIYKIKTQDGHNPGITLFNSIDSSILAPKPITEPTDIYSNTINYISITDQARLRLDENELKEIYDAMKILGIPDDKNIINEIALCTGSDVTNPIDQSTEIINAQIALFLDVDYDINILMSEGDILDRTIEIGGMEPLALD